MQARIKATGQIIELCPYVYDIDGNDFLLEEVELLNNTNWQQVRIQAAIEFAAQILANHGGAPTTVAKDAVDYADALVEELKRSDDVYAECRRLDSINTASVCENMTKIQKELQKKVWQDE